MTVKTDAAWWTDSVMYWLEGQVAITFHSPLPLSSSREQSTKDIIASLKLHDVDAFLQERGFKLKPLNTGNMPQGQPSYNDSPHSHDDNDIYDPCGKYLFASPSGQGTIVVSFFNIKQAEMPHPVQDMRIAHQLGGFPHSNDSDARQVAKLLNRNLKKFRLDGQVPIVAAMPNWLGGATGCITHGCSTRTFPVGDDGLNEAPQGWTFRLPELSAELRNRTGKGVTMFVLDTMPGLEQVKNAATAAQEKNWLLKDFASQLEREDGAISAHYQKMPALLAEDADDLLVTGRDIYGQPSGFKMPDHGLFVTGILRDLAPDAHIEYTRTLNDYGVCDIHMLIHELEKIHWRLTAGDLHSKPVVINLSLVVIPPHDELPHFWYSDEQCTHADEMMEMMEEMDAMHAPLHLVMQSLTSSGAVVVASAGNDSNTPDMPERMVPRYPAAFPEVISVGAVDSAGEAVPYSDYPALLPDHNGIVTYGGALAGPKPSSPEPHVEAKIDPSKPTDAPRGIYSAPTYPSLSADAPDKEYGAPTPAAWAYWSGTSFSTPIISAVAARLLELHADSLPTHLRAAQIQWAITTARGQQKMLTSDRPLPVQPLFGVGILKAVQEPKK